jgi:hypothetical protein
MNQEMMQPFRGFLAPGLYFSRGYCVWLSNFTSTPAGPAYSEIGLLTPTGRRTVYFDAGVDRPDNCTLQQYDEAVAASLFWGWPDRYTLHMSMQAFDGTTADLYVFLARSLRASLLNGLLWITPQRLVRTRPMLGILELCMELLLDASWLKLGDHARRGKAFLSQGNRVAIVHSAAAWLKGEALGELTRPPGTILAGDLRVPDHAFFSFGTVYLARGGA